MRPSAYAGDIEMSEDQKTILDPSTHDIMLREILKDYGGDGATKKLARRKLDSAGFVNAFCNHANSAKRIARLKSALQLAESMSEVSRAQQEEALAKKRLEDPDAFIKAAPDALIKLRKHECDELGPNAWFAKLTVDQLRAIAYEYYKVKVA